MEKFFLFVAGQWPLFAVLLALLSLLIALEMRRGGRRLSPPQLTELINRDKALVVDVRPANEFAAGHISGSLNIPHASLDRRISEIQKHRQKAVIVVCAAGQHAGAVVHKLREAGFQDVFRLGGGMMEWSYRQLPLVLPGKSMRRQIAKNV